MVLKVFLISFLVTIQWSETVFCESSSRDGFYTGKNQPNGETGNKEHQQMNPRFEFLGTYGNKMIYIERTAVNQENARIGCEALGLELLTVQSSEELNWIFEHTVSTDDRSWTAGINKRGRAAFEWANGEQISDQIELSSITEELGLQIDRWTTGSKLFSALSSNEQYYLCSENIA